MQIIYGGKDFNAIPMDLGNRIMAYKPHGSQVEFLIYNLLYKYDCSDYFHNIIRVEGNGGRVFHNKNTMLIT